jgi:hypothetical protein
MLRLILAILLIVNIGFYAWSRGGLDDLVGLTPDGEREPARLGQQVTPEVVKILPPQVAASAPHKTTQAAGVCLEIGPFSASQMGAAQTLLQVVVPPERWIGLKTETPATWIVHMAPSRDSAVQQKQIGILQRLEVLFEEVSDVARLGNGLSLGKFSNRVAAEKAMVGFTSQGLHRLKVAEFIPTSFTHTLRVDRTDSATQAQLRKLQGHENLADRQFKVCETP